MKYDWIQNDIQLIKIEANRCFAANFYAAFLKPMCIEIYENKEGQYP